MERLAHEQLRHQEAAAVGLVLAKVVDDERVGVVQLGGDARLGDKAPRELLLLVAREGEQLHRHLTVKREVRRLIDCSKAPLTELLGELVAMVKEFVHSSYE